MNHQHKMIHWISFLASLLWLSSTMNSLESSVDAMSNIEKDDDGKNGTKWAILVAGSNGYVNYRHQADVCHAYQVLKKGGLKDENIVVFMYDDIAYDEENPRPGVLINKPNGPNVYKGVPKDYTGENTNVDNFYAVISGNRSAISGGSGKVVNSGPNDHIFIYYSDHGGPGSVSMPTGGDVIANDFIEVLKKKHAAKGYKKMVIYMEACESGSMFEGLLPENISIFATTASNAEESSYAAYCDDKTDTCLGDVYSVSWMEDSDKSDRRKETVEHQFETVRQRTLHWQNGSSHVMQYGDRKIGNDFLVTYIGANPSKNVKNSYISPFSNPSTALVSQRDATLLYLRNKVEKAPNGSVEKLEAQKRLEDEIAHREYVDKSMKLLGSHLFGEEKSITVMNSVRPSGQPLVDDWDCFKKIMKIYESHCGTLSTYGRKYQRTFANMCNAGISEEKMVAAASQACS